MPATFPIGRLLPPVLALVASTWAIACDQRTATVSPAEPATIAAVGSKAERLLDLLGGSPPSNAPPTLVLFDVDTPPSLRPSPTPPSPTPLVIDVHQIEEAYALIREAAASTGRGEHAERLIRRLHRPLAARSTAYLGARRPCVAVIVDAAPLTLAGGHSFETDLVQLLGAESATHGGETPTRIVDEDGLTALPVDLYIATGAALEAPALLAALGRRIAPRPLRTAPDPGDLLWLGDAAEVEALLDAWAPIIETVRGAPTVDGSCARAPRPTSTI